MGEGAQAMSLLSVAELAALRAAAAAVMTDTCTIQQATAGQDAIGQPTRSWSQVATGVACRLRLRSVQERVLGERTSGVGAWELWLPYDQDISREMRVLAGTRTFEVVGSNAGESDRIKTVCDLVEVT